MSRFRAGAVGLMLGVAGGSLVGCGESTPAAGNLPDRMTVTREMVDDHPYAWVNVSFPGCDLVDDSIGNHPATLYRHGSTDGTSETRNTIENSNAIKDPRVRKTLGHLAQSSHVVMVTVVDVSPYLAGSVVSALVNRPTTTATASNIKQTISAVNASGIVNSISCSDQ